jgi:hypothetical protein
MNEPTITILPESKDARPELPPIESLWILRYQQWYGDGNYGKAEWRTNTSMFPLRSALEADKEAERLVTSGCRRVQIIKIQGDE